MATHTPGPWMVHESGAQVLGGAGDLTSICNTFGPSWAAAAERATNLARKEKFHALAAEMDANARLIAAAPEQYDALRELRDVAAMVLNRQHAGQPVADRIWSDLFTAVNKAGTVLAKVEG